MPQSRVRFIGSRELHRDLLESSQNLCSVIVKTMPEASSRHTDYLEALVNLDGQSIEWIKQILAGQLVTNRT